MAKGQSFRLSPGDRLRSLEARARALAAKIQAPLSALPCFSNLESDGPRVSLLGAKWLIIFGEDGDQRLQLATEEEDEVLYWVFDAVTFQMAAKIEARQRLHAFQSGRCLFSTQLRLLETLNPHWAERKKKRSLASSVC